MIAVSLLCGFLVVAGWYDLKSHRIPNWLVAGGTVIALVLHSVLLAGFGFISAAPGALGLLGSLKGSGLGLALFLPFYMLRLMGAGDVKLMAMVGAFLGIPDILWAMLATFLAGGVLTVVIGLARGVLKQTFHNIVFMVNISAIKVQTGSLPSFDEAPKTAAKLPYGVAIALGTMGYVLYKANKIGML
ncbi:MAG: A24 family peptidase [Burkholderiales bacterium]